MLPQSLRLTRSFDIVFRKGAKVSTPFFVLRAIPARDEKNRLAVVVSKKTEKSAVRRNRIRRRLIEAAKKAGFPEICAFPFRIVVIGFSPILTGEFEKIVEEMAKGLTKISKK